MSSSATLADQGLAAFNNSKYSDAIALYSQALSLNPDVPDYYLKRSIAYQRSAQYELALQDAEVSLMLSHRRGKREGVGSAQIRRGIALQLLCRYGDAYFCFTAAESKCHEKDRNVLGMWKKRVEMALEKVDPEDTSREVTVEEIPNISIPTAAEQIPPNKPDLKNSASAETDSSHSPIIGVATPVSKIRHEWYQTPTQVVLTLYVKGVPKEKASIEITSSSLSITFPLSSGNDFVFDIDPLFYDVDPLQSSYSVLVTKIELKLLKADSGKKWPTLEGTQKHTAVDEDPAQPLEIKDKPVYPTSSKSGPKDWDQVAAALTAKSKKEKNKDGDPDGEGEAEYESDYEGGDPVNFFFKKLYKDADEDTRRAMMKSYVESNGTALSTNWSEVGNGKVETSPPDGMEAKAWGQ
ncbi:SGS domain-containing protein [Geopyxis carbonaria]|nr:SGS domain-containing protein [Geopyxis carbonaria]